VSDLTASEVVVDLEAVRELYRRERDKRLHPEGSAQYRQMADELEHFTHDTYDERIERDPVFDEVEVAILGGGFGGLLLGARMREIGVENLRVVEQGGDFGGTWYWNRYPGARCDTESYIYLPLLEETGYVPSEKYVAGPEIFEHCQRIASQYDLYANALLQTKVTDVSWSEEDAVWTVRTDRGDAFRARYVCMTTGAMVKPKLPGVPGIESFEGHTFHTTRWDYDYTGGSPEGELTGLADKSVAIIGTGATGVQVIPHVAASAARTYVVQRTPSSINIRNNRPTDLEWAKTLEPGWQRERQTNFSMFVAGADVETDLVQDGWTAIYRLRALSGGVLDERLDYLKMEEIRARVDAVVKDSATAAGLKPYYRALCKRPCFHDEYLDAFNRPTVTLLDTDGRGLERVTPKGIVVNGVEHPVDCIIFASGFQIGGPLVRRLGYDVTGRDGLRLSEKWSKGISTLHGMQTRGFPNFFIVNTPQVGISSNQGHVLEVQSRHIAYLVDQARSREARTVDVTQDSEDAWVQKVIDDSRASIEFLASCTPGYYNNEGNPSLEVYRRNTAYSPGIVAFDDIITAWRGSGRNEGLEFA
jgi:cyclohexanone monooxygenase